MPCRNVLKTDVESSFYHVYARGHARQQIFRDDSDYLAFLAIFERYLSTKVLSDKYGKPYVSLRGQIELLAYCLIDNHFHLLFYQTDKGAMSKLMRSVMTSYSCYFNKKYDSTGALFETRYKASLISSNDYLAQISRYIHLVPGDWLAYPYSSVHSYFIGAPDWLQPDRVVGLFGSTPVYADFLNDSTDYEKSLDYIKDELANQIE